MAKVFEENGYTVVIWPDDHIPPHVHVFKAGRQMRIAIGGPGTEIPWIYDAMNMPRHDQKDALRLVIARQGECLKVWRSFHA